METTDISEFILSSAKVIKKSQSMLLMQQMYDWDFFYPWLAKCTIS